MHSMSVKLLIYYKSLINELGSQNIFISTARNPFNLENVFLHKRAAAELLNEFGFLTLKVLKELCSVQPGAEAGQAPLSDLLPALVGDHLAVLPHDHQLGHGGDLVPLLQLAVDRKHVQG